MNELHPNDLEIQTYVFDRQDCPPQTLEHIQSCRVCSKQVSFYEALSTDIKNDPGPVLDYNLSTVILDQLPSNKEVEVNHNYLTRFIILIIAGFTLLILYLFAAVMINLVDSSHTYQYLFIISIIVFISIAHAIDLFRSFYKKTNILSL